VRIIVGAAPGGAFDISRFDWSVALGAARPAFIYLKPAGGRQQHCREAVVNAPADGHTLLLVSSVNASNARSTTSSTSISSATIAPLRAWFASPKSCWSSTFRPRRCPSSSPTPGQSGQDQHGIGWQRDRPHLGGELLKMEAASIWSTCHIAGARQRLTDLIGGQVQVMFIGPIEVVEHIKTGRLRALAVTRRSVWTCAGPAYGG